MDLDLKHGATIAVAMSGGVDSSVVATLLKKQGYNVIGFTLKLHSHNSTTKQKTCCANKDIDDARYIASHINIPHYVLDYENQFNKEVVEQFVNDYLNGYTPIPCIKCNQTVKFRDLFAMAKKLGADALATGHYARRKKGIKSELHQGLDFNKDQSYFLFATTDEQIDFLRFPLGEKTKEETRLLAKTLGLPVAQKPDSQGICFVGNRKYTDFLRATVPHSEKLGTIVHEDGTILGQHHGIINFTIGQRKRIGIGGRKNQNPRPLYVIKIKPKTQEIIVGPKESLKIRNIQLQYNSFNWIGDYPLSHIPESVTIRIRSSMKPVQGTVCKKQRMINISFTNDIYGISPGQACVLYHGTRVLGGGWISH